MKHKLSVILTAINILLLSVFSLLTYFIFTHYKEIISNSKLASDSFLQSFIVNQNSIILILGALFIFAVALKEKIPSKNITTTINIFVLITLLLYAFLFYYFLNTHLQGLIIQSTTL